MLSAGHPKASEPLVIFSIAALSRDTKHRMCDRQRQKKKKKRGGVRR